MNKFDKDHKNFDKWYERIVKLYDESLDDETYYKIQTALTQAAEIESGDKVVVDGWQPIESAPTGGVKFICWVEKPTCQDNEPFEMVTFINSDNQYEGMMFYYEPTHWMPLPQPPTSEGCLLTNAIGSKETLNKLDDL